MYVLHGIVGYPSIPRINKVKYSAIPYNTLWYPTIPCDITNYIFQLHIFHFLISIWLWGCQEWRWERWRRGGHGQTLALQWWWWRWWWWWWVGKTWKYNDDDGRSFIKLSYMSNANVWGARLHNRDMGIGSLFIRKWSPTLENPMNDMSPVYSFSWLQTK